MLGGERFPLAAGPLAVEARQELVPRYRPESLEPLGVVQHAVAEQVVRQLGSQGLGIVHGTSTVSLWRSTRSGC